MYRQDLRTRVIRGIVERMPEGLIINIMLVMCIGGFIDYLIRVGVLLIKRGLQHLNPLRRTRRY